MSILVAFWELVEIPSFTVCLDFAQRTSFLYGTKGSDATRRRGNYHVSYFVFSPLDISP